MVALLLIANKFHLPGGFKLYVVKSGSMEPTIHTGSLVAVSPAKSYAKGDIITFGPDTKDQAPTTHRIVEENGDEITTKGDANNTVDSRKISENDIIGRVHWWIPFLGYILALAKTSVGFVILIVIPATIVIYDEIRNMAEEVKKLRKKKENEDQEKSN